MKIKKEPNTWANANKIIHFCCRRRLKWSWVIQKPKSEIITSLGRSDVVHLVVSWIIKLFLINTLHYIGSPAEIKWKLKFETAAPKVLFYFESYMLFRGGWWLPLWITYSALFCLCDPQKQHLINTRLLNGRNGPFYPLFPFLLQRGDTDATSGPFLEFHPKVFFLLLSAAGRRTEFHPLRFLWGLKFRAICPACHHRLGGSRRSRWSPVWRLFSSPTAWSSGWVGLPPNGGNNKLKEQQWAKKG